MDTPRIAAEDAPEQVFEEETITTADDDELPPPAYQPQVAAFEPRFEEESIEAEPEAYVAPRAPAPGTPSPEALARLRAAAHKANPDAQRAAQPQQQRPEPTASGQAGQEKPRFGINSLINRMTGHGEGESQPQGQQRPTRQQPSMQQPQRGVAAAPQPSQEPDADQERIEIPAFLRRQAN